MQKELNALPLYPSGCHLGESAMWHPERKSIFWVDIMSYEVYEFNLLKKKASTFKLSNKPTVILPGMNSSELIMGLDAGIGKLNLDTRNITWLMHVEDAGKNTRCNDGNCDANGNLWIGTLHNELKKNAGSLYHIDQNLVITKKIENVTISNGLVWSLDSTLLYYIDTFTNNVKSFNFNLSSSEIIFEREVISIPKKLGSPDGMTIDENGMLWIAHYGGFGVYCWNPETGKLLEKINVPVPNVTSCCFAGENLDYLIITTAKENLSNIELAKYPQSGDTFYIKMQTKGFNKNKCSL